MIRMPCMSSPAQFLMVIKTEPRKNEDKFNANQKSVIEPRPINDVAVAKPTSQSDTPKPPTPVFRVTSRQAA